MKINHKGGKSLGKGTISLCTIVKNEEKFITQCLESVKNVVDEIVLVDTGSTDNTIEIAERYDAKVYIHPWQNSFSEARNYALQFVTGEWILHLDADEELEQADIALLKKVIRSDRYNAVFMPILNYLPNGNMSKFYYRRLFRSGKGYYEGIVHNQIIVEGDFITAEIRIYHHGYNLSSEEMAAKHERSETLLKKQIADEPDNLFARFNLTRIYRNLGQYDKAIAEAKQVLTFDTCQEQKFTYYMVLFDLAYCLMMIGNYDEAAKYCLEGLKHERKNLDLTFTLASVYAKQEKYEDAIAMFHRFLDILAQSKKDPSYNMNTLIVDSWSFEDKALNNIGQCYLLMGQTAQGIQYYEDLITKFPDNITFYNSLALWYIQNRELDKALDVWQIPIDAGFADGFVYFKVGEIFREISQLDLALENYEKAIRYDYANPDLYNSYGFVLFIKERFEES